MNNYKLKELLSIKNGKDHKELNDGTIPIYGSGGIMRYGDKAIYDDESILLPRKGTLSNIQYINEPFWTVDTIYYTVINKKLANPFYLYNYLKSLDLTKLNSGTGVPSMTFNSYYDLEINVPDLPTQRSIAKVLSDLDAKIELNNKINQELEAMAKTLYDYWFVQFDFPTPPSSTSGIVGKPYKSSGGKMVYNEELKREIPEGWEVKELGDCIKIFDHKRIPLSSKERETYKGIIPYYGATGILDYVNDFIFNDDLILLAEDGSVMDENGFPIVQFIWGKTWVNNHAHVIQANKKTQNEFYFQLLKRIPVILIKTGSIQMKINQKNLCNYKILTPSEDLIDKFSEVSRTIRKSLINITEQNQQLSSLRDWLLPMLMNGQVASRASATAE